MHKLHITVYEFAAADQGNRAMPIPMVPPLEELHVDIDLKSHQSEVFHKRARFIMVKAEADCCLAFGENPEAKQGVHPVDAGEIRWYGVFPGHRLAVIEAV